MCVCVCVCVCVCICVYIYIWCLCDGLFYCVLFKAFVEVVLYKNTCYTLCIPVNHLPFCCSPDLVWFNTVLLVSSPFVIYLSSYPCLPGVNSLAQSLSANQSIPSTLTHLDLSGNILRGDDLTVGTPSPDALFVE